MYRKNTAGQFFAFQGVNATNGAALSGVTWTTRRCIDGTFAAATGTATEDSTNGWYKFAMSQADTNGNNIQFNFTGSGAVPMTVNILTDGNPPSVNLANILGTASAGAAGYVGIDWGNVNAPTSSLNLSATTISGLDNSAVKKDVALSNFEFLMTDSTNHAPATGLTVTATRSIDGGSFASGALSAVTEIGSGIYAVNFAAADLNGKVITLRATASGADDLLVTIITDS